jgi:hypothetical protein
LNCWHYCKGRKFYSAALKKKNLRHKSAESYLTFGDRTRTLALSFFSFGRWRWMAKAAFQANGLVGPDGANLHTCYTKAKGTRCYSRDSW